MTSPHERLSQAMDARRLDLGLSWKDVAAASTISEATLRAIRSGTNRPTALTARRIEDALQWRHGSIDVTLNGGDPSLITDTAAETTIEDLAAQVAELTRKVAELDQDRRRESG